MAKAKPLRQAGKHGRRRQPEVVTLVARTGALAVRLLALARSAGERGVLYVPSSERRGEALGRALDALAPDMMTVVFPAWDCLPYDRAPPSREVTARRVVALARLAQETKSLRIVIATPDALVQRVPSREVWASRPRVLVAHARIDPEDLEKHLRGLGYLIDERVDGPGEAALQGQVIDLFPPAAVSPVRIEHADGTILAMRAFDPVTQLTIGDAGEVSLLPAAEYATLDGEDAAETTVPSWLPPASATLATLFDYVPDATIVLDEKAEERRQAALELITDAYRERTRTSAVPGARAFPPPDRFYLDGEEWAEQLETHRSIFVESSNSTGAQDDGSLAVPSFATAARPGQALAKFVKTELKTKRRVVLAAATDAGLRTLSRHAVESLSRQPRRVPDWNAVLASRPGALLLLKIDIDGGFIDDDASVTVVSAIDLLGSRARGRRRQDPQAPALLEESEFRIGDAVIHLDHGMGLLEGLATVETDLSEAADTIRLAYAGNDKLMAPVNEFDRIWRYGAGETASLDHLDGEAWPKRRAKIEAGIADTARRLADLARAREAKSAARLVPPRQLYERFAARFPFSETPDQLRAIEDVLGDLASGRPMDRLVCGDVGFGKTEVALRAAAAAALAGRQVAIVAPTTVLVRQHLQTFRRRFAGFGVEIAHLSRLVTPAQAGAARKGLADGTVRIVIGTHALAGRGVRFRDLGLVVIDEEQRFGLAHKRKLRDLAADAHVLTLTATPIPRTMQAAMLGLQDLSIMATPPAQRRAIRTFVAPLDEITVRQALFREHRRGGQSFVVCPRIEDIEPMAKRVAALVPELQIVVAHGKMPAEAIDEVMVRFAAGEGDVLLATNIIESGLDVPCANTMLIWRADRFGLAQLHQLRGRVGRGRVRGIAYLLTDPAAKVGAATRKRLQTLESLDRLGAGFAISARDLDARGAGDLFGEEQAGHVKLIGLGLYRQLLGNALRATRGEPPREEWAPELNVGGGGRIPHDYVPDAEVRISLYARLARSADEDDLMALQDEIEDRFGPPAEPVRELLTLARLKHLCRGAGIARVDAGPQAIAVTFRREVPAASAVETLIKRSKGALEWRGERLVYARSTKTGDERRRVTLKLLRKLAETLA